MPKEKIAPGDLNKPAVGMLSFRIMGTAEQTLQTIMKATLKIIRESGCEAFRFSRLLSETGLSKGAIFHYFSGKSDLFARILKMLLQEMDIQFKQMLSQKPKTAEELVLFFTEPLKMAEKKESPLNEILKYLINHENDEEARSAFQDFYKAAFEYSKNWILLGIEQDIIHPAGNIDKLADLFVLINLGLRARSGVEKESTYFRSNDFVQMMETYLKIELPQ